MSNKLSYEDLQYRLEAEGEGYALKHYYGRDIEHDDEKMIRLWAETYDKLKELEVYIDECINKENK